MICFAFPDPIFFGVNRRHLPARINIISKPRSKLYKKLPIVVYLSQISSRLNLSSVFKSSAMVKKASDAASTVMLTSGASGRINALLSLRLLKSLWLLINAFLLIFLLPFREGRSADKGGNGGGGKEDKPQGKVVRVPAMMVPRKSAAAAVDKEVAARRALAIQRVMEDNGTDGDVKESVRDFSLLVSSRGDTIFTQSWTPANIKVR